MSLEKFLQGIISEKEGVPAEKITCSFISEYREEHPVPVVYLSEGCPNGDLVYMNQEEFMKEESSFDEFLNQFQKKGE